MPNMQGNSAVHLVEKGGKYSSFDKHRQFLPADHPFRRDIKNFMKGVVVTQSALQMLTGAVLHAQVSGLWRLPYINDLLLPHNIDAMHTEKNWGEALFGTVMDIPDKTKDNIKARVDLATLCDRPRYEMKTPRPRRQ